MMEEGYVKPYRETIVKLIVKQCLKGLVKQAPIFASGPLGWIMSKFLFWIVPKLLDNTILGLNIMWVRTENQGNVDKLNKLFEDSKKDLTPEERDSIEKQINSEWDDLVNLTKRRL